MVAFSSSLFKLDMSAFDLPNIPITSNVLASFLKGFKAPGQKIIEMEKNGEIVRLKRGLFLRATEKPNMMLVANHIYGPSYISRESALRYYGLIPEHVYTTTSVSINRSRVFENKLGRFSYDCLPVKYYRLGIEMKEENGICFQIATPEKALTDLIVLSPKVRLRYLRETREYLENDLRIDMDIFVTLKPERFEEYAAVSKKSQTMLNIVKLLRQ